MFRRLHAAADRVQGGEQLILGVDLRAGHGVEQGGFTRVGVAHQRHHGNLVLLSVLAAQLPLLLHRLQAAAQLRHALTDAAAVHLQLGFTRAAGADAARQPRQHQTLADQTGGLVLQLRQLHLQLALRAGGPLGEDVQDQRGAVHHLHVEDILQVAHLDARQLLVQDAHVCLQGLALAAQFIRPAPTDEQRVVRLVPLLQVGGHHLRPGGVRQPRQFLQGLLALDAHEHRPLPVIRLLLLRFPAHQAVAFLHLLHPGRVRRAVPADGLVHEDVLLLPQEGRLHEGGLALQAADGHHGVVAEGAQGGQIHVAEPPVAIGMGVDAAHAAEPLGVAAQAVVPQLHVPIRAHADLHNLPVPGNVYGDLPVHGGGEAGQRLHQLPREKHVLVHLIQIQLPQRGDQGILHAGEVAMHFLFHHHTSLAIFPPIVPQGGGRSKGKSPVAFPGWACYNKMDCC